MELMEHQLDVIERLGNGKILWGNVGSGKTAAVLGYYVKYESPRDIYVITTAKKRDSLDWEKEAADLGIGTSPERDDTLHGILTVDSWNKLHMYKDVSDAFFIFDEQRVGGHGAWAKTFIKIARKNRWVLLSATPGDTWLDYASVFIANGFYDHITDFKRKHVLYEPYVRYPKVRGYLNVGKLELLRNDILVEMSYLSDTKRYLNYLDVGYDHEAFIRVYKKRWHIYEERPLTDASEMFRVLRRLVNTHPSRLQVIRCLLTIHPRLIIFYNWNYELDILRTLCDENEVFEWNGHQKDPLPEGDKWVYLVQYVSGAESWNCTTTDAMVLYSLTYSYKNFQQALGRIDRLNTNYKKLYYYLLVSDSRVDKAVKDALSDKRDFNERRFVKEIMEKEGVI